MGDPVVYPDLKSVLDDINFKTFLEIEPTKVFTPDFIEVRSLAGLRRSLKYAFIVDDATFLRK